MHVQVNRPVLQGHDTPLLCFNTWEHDDKTKPSRSVKLMWLLYKKKLRLFIQVVVVKMIKELQWSINAVDIWPLNINHDPPGPQGSEGKEWTVFLRNKKNSELSACVCVCVCKPKHRCILASVLKDERSARNKHRAQCVYFRLLLVSVVWNTLEADMRFSMYWPRTWFSDLSFRFSSFTASTRAERSLKREKEREAGGVDPLRFE